MDQDLLRELFDKISKISVDVASLTATSKAKETTCEAHQKQMVDHDLRIRVLEIAFSSNTGSNNTSNNWKNTLIQIVMMGATVAMTIIATRA
jgi:hypothetical protein